jgi:uncharacterized protein CbrC (UPF0167 family)
MTGMEELPAFPLFRDPVGQESFEESDVECEACGRARGWVYTCGMYGPGDLDRSLCPWCIADGSAAAKFGLSFNDATIYPCLEGSPQLPKDDQRMVETRTPGFTTWQDNGWRMCCGRACVYIGEAQEGDLMEGGRWAAAAPDIVSSVEDWPEDERAELLDSFGVEGSPAAYIFECGQCGALKGFWDCD